MHSQSTFGIRFVVCAILAMAGADAQTRTLRGTVLNSKGTPLEGAVVQLKNLRTLRIRSFVAEKSGAFQFVRLNMGIDYEVRAHFRKRWSESKMVSHFDSSPTVEVTLTVETDAPLREE
jgi:hypothetical protein